MNSKFKRLLVCLLSLMMVVSLFSMSAITASAAEIDETNTVSESNDEITVVDGGTWGGIDWTYTNDGTLTIAPTDNEITKTKPWSGELYQRGELPAAVNDAITGITGWPYKGYTINKLVIEEGVTSIGSFALSGAKDRLTYASSIGEVVLPSTLTYVGQEGLQTIPMTKLTFAEGGTKELCFSAGSLKSLKVTELVFPADRPAICIHTWALNDCNSMETIVFPANTTFKPYNHVDYYGDPNDVYTWDSQILARCWALETLTFGSEEVRTSFYNGANNTANINAIKAKNPNFKEEVKAPSVAQIGEQGFETLAGALAAAKAGDTITFLADINENVTINKSVTIDGAGKTYTGQMIPTANTVKIKNVNFDGKGYGGYAVVTKGAYYVTIEDCTVKNYTTYGFLNINSNNDTTTVRNVTGFDIGYGVKIDSCNSLTLEDVKISASVAAVLNCNNGYKPITIKNSELSILGTWKKQTAVKTLYTFEGANKIDEFIIEPDLDTFKLAAGATLTAPEDITVTTVDGYEVVYENGIYTSKVAKLPSGYVAYRADVTDKADREGIAILLKDVYAKNSLVVKVYHNDTLLFTSARRDIDDEGKVMFPVNANTTANIVLWGKESGSWINEILVKPNELNVPNKIEVWADGVLVSTYTHESGTVLGVNLDKYLALDAVQQPVAKVGTKTYKTLQAAIDACPAGGKVTLLRNAKGPGVVINKNITINFNGKTYYVNKGVGSTGTESNGFQILAGNKVTLSGGTLKVAEEAADKFYILVQNYADLSCFNMNLDGTYLDKWSKTDGDSYVLSNNSGYISLTGKTYITTNNDGDKAFAFDACDSKYYADKPVVFAATTVKIDGKAVSESYDKIEAAARIGSTQFFASLKEAFAYASNGNTIKLMADVAVSEGITNAKKVTLDLNGKTITGTDNTTGSFGLITNKGQLTIIGNGKITLTATNNRGWSAYSSVISNQPGGKLIVESGTIEHLGGTDMAYGIDNLTNGKGTYAETIINGGTIKSTYRAIRMFLNGVEAQNILTINGGVVEGDNKSVWMQDPSKNANTGNLTITKGAVINGDVYLTVTAGSTEWPVEVSIAASAVNGEVLTSNIPTGYKLVNNKGVYSVEKVKTYIAQVGVTKYESLQAAIDACPEYGKVTLLCDAKGPGVVIDKNITILFNGHTYTITEPVGSAGTKTLGFQILKGNKVVLNNGKIEIAEEAADKFAILIQNYADLTVYQMTLDGTNLGRYENYSYVLSVNCGKVTVNGKSVLTAKDGEGNYALDVYDYSSAGYSLPTVTVTSVVKINGKISAGAKYSTVYYATVEQAKATNPGKNVTVLN